MTFTTRRIREEESLRGQSLRPSLLVRTAGFFGGWYQRWKQREEAEEQAHRRVRFLKRTAVVLFSVFAGAVLLAGTVKGLITLRILTPHTLFAVAGKDLPTDANGLTNILLLGGGDKSHDGVDLLDSIMVASIDPTKTKSVVLISLPRDLYVDNTEKMGHGRVNSLYRDYKWYIRNQEKVPIEEASTRALDELALEVGKIVGLEIHRVVKIDFIAFVQAVDALGGVDIEVPYDIVDPEYPGANYSYETFEIRAGLQHLDGETALKYARSRHTTSDFDRSARQQQLLRALAEKAKTEGIASSPGKITALLKIMAEHVETNVAYTEMLGLGKMGEDMDRQNVISVQLHAQGGYDSGIALPGGFLFFPPRDWYNGASVLRPVVLGDDGEWDQIRTFARLLTQSRSVHLANPHLVILNGGAANGVGRTLGNELTRNSFVVADTDNASDDRTSPLRNLEHSMIIPRTETDKPLAEFFATLLQIPTGTAPVDLPIEKLGQVTILLGKDYTFTPLRNLVPSDNDDTGTDDAPLSSVSSMNESQPAAMTNAATPDPL